jgi:hypothetical protein
VQQHVEGKQSVRVHFRPALWKRPVAELVAADSPFQRVYSGALRHTPRSCALILDPSNPTKNMADDITAAGWQLLLHSTDPKCTLI